MPVAAVLLALDPPSSVDGLPGALGVGVLSAVAYWLILAAWQRGPIGRVSPIGGLSTAVTALLGILVLSEVPTRAQAVGITFACFAVVLLSWRAGETGKSGWLAFVLAFVLVRGAANLLTKSVVSGGEMATFFSIVIGVEFIVSAVAVVREGKGLIPTMPREIFWGSLAVLVLSTVALALYVAAIERAPISVVVPLVATSAGFGGFIGTITFKEGLRPTHFVGIALALVGAVLLAF